MVFLGGILLGVVLWPIEFGARDLVLLGVGQVLIIFGSILYGRNSP